MLFSSSNSSYTISVASILGYGLWSLPLYQVFRLYAFLSFKYIVFKDLNHFIVREVSVLLLQPRSLRCLLSLIWQATASVRLYMALMIFKEGMTTDI